MARKPARPKNAERRAMGAVDALTIEGALITPAQIALVVEQGADDQHDVDYCVPKGLTLREEISRYFRIGQAHFADLVAADQSSHPAAVRFTEALLKDVLGFGDVRRVGHREHDGHVHPVTLEALGGRVPVVVVPASDPLDRPSACLAGPGRTPSAAVALQDWLNANDDALWGLACNGEALRLVRDNPSLTRPAYIEANLRAMFQGEALADFAALWLLVHASRFGNPGSPPSECPLERWRDDGQKAGLAARDRLRDGVEAALRAVGTGFLSHPDNVALRAALESRSLELEAFHGLLLRLVYRLIFLYVAEDRGLLHPPGAPAAARSVYAEGYSVSHLRERAARRSFWDAHDDLWDGLLVVFEALGGRGAGPLGLPALGGLFAFGGLGALEQARLPNRALMEAVWNLAWLRDGGAALPVNWRDMETEELGSVYESLLELTPRRGEDGRTYGFAEGLEAQGHERKTSGSYYTPDSLVQLLLESALDPVLDRAEADAEDPVQGLLRVTVIDPACGSGHFLLAAARRIATRIAKARTGGVTGRDDRQHALRDVVRSCIHGVDRNPMAVELTKVALWIETVEPGKPLGFLDANIRCGDALLGVFDLAALDEGIPDAAYKPLTGDDREAARTAMADNRQQRARRRERDLFGHAAAQKLSQEARAVLAMPEDDLTELDRKAEAYAALHARAGWSAQKLACDLYVAAFLRPKRPRGGEGARAGAPDLVPTTLDVRTALTGGQPDARAAAMAIDLAEEAHAFHWPLEFPAAAASGGFDVVLGNPPWEVMQLNEEEYFAREDPEIAGLAGAHRKRAIASLEAKNPTAFHAYQMEKRRFEAGNEFARSSGRFDLTARGKVNSYALFAELFDGLLSSRGRAGVILPTGIATESTTAAFFGALVDRERLIQLLDFENRERIFQEIDSRIKFCLLTIGNRHGDSQFSFFLTAVHQVTDPDRRFALSAEDIERINPNTKTAPIFRAGADAELTRGIYRRVPILVRENAGHEVNPWGIQVFTRLWNMTEDAAWFRTSDELKRMGLVAAGSDWVLPSSEAQPHAEYAHHAPSGGPDGVWDRYVPLYEAKMVHQFDHRWATHDGLESRDSTDTEKCDPAFDPTPRYWVPQREMEGRLASVGWNKSWIAGWRNITNATNERTSIFSLMPRTGAGNTISILMPDVSPNLLSALIANLNAITLDFVARAKIGGTHLTYGYLQQFPVILPESYDDSALDFLNPRVLELTYTSHSMGPFARDLGYNGPPFAWDEKRRAWVRAELDAWFARAYGLTRDELRYVLDPGEVLGDHYPSETFRVLKENEKRRFDEYRTGRLVLEAWDAQEADRVLR